MQHQASHLVRRRLDPDVLRSAAQRHRILALIPGPHLAREDLAGCLRRGASLRSATDERHENERSDYEPGGDLHGAEPPTNAVPLTIARCLRHMRASCAAVCGRLFHVCLWTTFPCL